MSHVWFLDYKDCGNVLRGLEKLFETISSVVSRGDEVAIKLHMGELGNITYIRPVFVRKVVELVKSLGGRPFVTDTTTIYPENRFTAEKYLETAAFNGFSESTLGAPIVIADGDGYDGVSVKLDKRVRGCEIDSIEVASKIFNADAMIVLSHVKGHKLTGFGGAIKNLGMGCVTKRAKAIQHSANKVVLDELKCSGCGKCVEKCPFDALEMVNGIPKRDDKKCMNCSHCLFVCPENALSWPEGCSEKLQVNIAHAAYAVLKAFKEGKVGYLNFVQDVTPLCDCAAPAGRPLIPDVGILASLDPVAIDKASVDLVDRAGPLLIDEKIDPPDILGKLNKVRSYTQLEVSEELGIGSLSYELVKV